MRTMTDMEGTVMILLEYKVLHVAKIYHFRECPFVMLKLSGAYLEGDGWGNG